jgi:hypothetical protein
VNQATRSPGRSTAEVAERDGTPRRIARVLPAIILSITEVARRAAIGPDRRTRSLRTYAR